MKLSTFMLLLLSLSLPSLGFAHTNEKHQKSHHVKDGGETPAVQKAIEPEEIEEIEEIKTQPQQKYTFIQNTPEAVNPNKEQVSLVEFFGRLHPALVHFPIAWLILLLLVEMSTYVFPLIKENKIGFATLILSVMSFIPAIASGLANASHLPPEDESLIQTMSQHRNFMFITFFVIIIALIFRMVKKNSLSGFSKWIYLILIITAATIMTFSADIGGQMVYGENYLF